MEENKKLKVEDNIKPGFKDYIAIAIAIFETAVPFVFALIVIVSLALVFITKVWLR